jgi:hypothetical protein
MPLPMYGTRPDRLPRAIRDALQAEPRLVSIVDGETNDSYVIRSLARFPVVGSDIDWDKVPDSELAEPGGDAEVAGLLADVLHRYRGDEDEVILMPMFTPQIPSVAMPVAFAAEHAQDLVLGFSGFWVYVPTSNVLVQCDMGSLSMGRVPDA